MRHCRRLTLTLMGLGLLLFAVGGCLERIADAQSTEGPVTREFKIPTEADRVVVALERRTNALEEPPRVEIFADGRVHYRGGHRPAGSRQRPLEFIELRDLLEPVVASGLLDVDERELAERQLRLTSDRIDDAPLFVYNFSVDDYRVGDDRKGAHSKRVGLIAPTLFRNSEAFMADSQMRALVELADVLEDFRAETRQ